MLRFGLLITVLIIHLGIGIIILLIITHGIHSQFFDTGIIPTLTSISIIIIIMLITEEVIVL